MTILKILLASTILFSASMASACSAHKADKTIYNSAGKYLKPGASMDYSHNLKSQLTAGEVVTFTLRLSEAYDQGQLNVYLESEGSIALFPASTQASFDMSNGSGHKMDVSFTSNANGRHYINVQAMATDGAGNAQPRIFSIPVQVGPITAQKPDPNMKIMQNGERVIEMEAEETLEIVDKNRIKR